MTKDQQLKVEVVDDRLVISIGIGLLAFAVQASSDASGWPEDWYVSDPAAFAAEVARQLENEEEDGTTPVHRMLDAAALEALEQGADGVEEGGPEKGLKIAKKFMGDDE